MRYPFYFMEACVVDNGCHYIYHLCRKRIRSLSTKKGGCNAMVRIMLVEDEMILLRAMQIVLVKEFGDGVEIITVSDEDEAINKVYDYCPEVVISDLRMKSKRGGLKLCEQIKKINPGAFFILCTGSKHDLENEHVCWDALIEKPFNGMGLVNVLYKYVQF